MSRRILDLGTHGADEPARHPGNRWCAPRVACGLSIFSWSLWASQRDEARVTTPGDRCDGRCFSPLPWIFALDNRPAMTPEEPALKLARETIMVALRQRSHYGSMSMNRGYQQRLT